MSVAMTLAGCLLTTSLDSFSTPPSSLEDGGLEVGDADPHDAGSTLGEVIDREASSEAGTTFVDTFDRPDGPVGNRWSEKLPGRFGILSNELTMQPGDYHDLLLLRPLEEESLDVELSVEARFFRLGSGSFDVQLLARVQNRGLGAGELTGYIGWLDDGSKVKIGRQHGTALDYLAERALTTPVASNERGRLTFRISGTSPVILFARWEHLQDSTWVVDQELSCVDADPTKISLPGAMGTASDDDVPYVLDQFTSTPK